MFAVLGLYLVVDCSEYETSGVFENHQSQFCMDINNQKSLDINQVSLSFLPKIYKQIYRTRNRN